MGRNYIESAELLRRGEESAQFKTIEALERDLHADVPIPSNIERSKSMKLKVYVQDETSGRSFEIEGEGGNAQEVVEKYNAGLKEGEPHVVAITGVQVSEDTIEPAVGDEVIVEEPEEGDLEEEE